MPERIHGSKLVHINACMRAVTHASSTGAAAYGAEQQIYHVLGFVTHEEARAMIYLHPVP